MPRVLGLEPTEVSPVQRRHRRDTSILESAHPDGAPSRRRQEAQERRRELLRQLKRCRPCRHSTTAYFAMQSDLPRHFNQGRPLATANLPSTLSKSTQSSHVWSAETRRSARPRRCRPQRLRRTGLRAGRVGSRLLLYRGPGRTQHIASGDSLTFFQNLDQRYRLHGGQCGSGDWEH
jgi:hypothetical protein